MINWVSGSGTDGGTSAPKLEGSNIATTGIRTQSYKTFFLSVVYEFSLAARVFVPGRPFQPSIVMVGKERSLPSCAAPETFFTWLSRSLSQNIILVLKGLTGTNTTAFVNNRQERFHHIGPRAKCYTTFYDHNLQCS